MRENRPYGSEGGEAKAFPTPISRSLTFPGVLTSSRRSESAMQFTEAGERTEFARPWWFSSSTG